MNRRDFLKLFGAAAAALSIGVSASPSGTEMVIYTSQYRNERRRADVIRITTEFRGEEYGIEILVEDGSDHETHEKYIREALIADLKAAGATSWRDGGERE